MATSRHSPMGSRDRMNGLDERRHGSFPGVYRGGPKIGMLNLPCGRKTSGRPLGWQGVGSPQGVESWHTKGPSNLLLYSLDTP
jgi:hypothetical protein